MAAKYKYQAGIPLRDLGVKEIPPSDLYSFLASEGNLPVMAKREMATELRTRTVAREVKTPHFQERMLQRGLNPALSFQEVLERGVVFQVNFDRADGRLRYVGVRLRNPATPLAHDVFVFQLEESFATGLVVVWVSGWKCPARRHCASFKQEGFSLLSEKTWDEVTALREANL